MSEPHTTVCVPSADAVTMLDAPAGVDVVVWDGLAERPPAAAAVEFLVGRYPGAAPPAATLAGLPRLRVVQLLSAGVDPWVPLVPAGVQLCNGRGVHGRSTAELAVTGVLALLRRLPAFGAHQAAGEWRPERTGDLDGRQVLILGAGDIAAYVAAALEVFGAQITLVGRTARDGVAGIEDVPALLPGAQVVVLALPDTPQTRGMVDADFLAKLPDGAILANVARGPIVDTDALLAELRAERLHAFLDVTDPEPLPAGHPLWSAPNVIITPHEGGGTIGWQRRAYRLVREQLARYRAGEPLLNVVTDGF